MSTQVKRVFPPFGMAPDVWGPIFWRTMHIVSLGYSSNPTEQEQIAAKQFYESLQYTIPCPICREHYSHILSVTPPRVDSRDALIEWVFDVHNKVNKQLGKPIFSWEQYVASMFVLRDGGASTGACTNWLLYGITGAALGSAAYYMYNKYK